MGILRRGESWFIDYYAGGRRVREKVGPSKNDARNALSVRKAQIAQGRFQLRTRGSSPTFEQFAERYEAFSKVNKRGFKNEEYRLRQLKQNFGKCRLADLNAWDGEKLKSRLSSTRKPATVNRLLGNLKHMMSKAVEWHLLDKNPFTEVKLLHVPEFTERILSKDEEEKLLAACRRVRAPHLWSIVTLALNTGMRRGEILSLQWGQVDLENRLVRIVGGKTAQSNRKIPMNETAFDLLSNLSRKNSLVFPSHRKEGEPFRDPKKAFATAIRLAGIEHLRFHDLRHTFATRLVRAGVDIITVQHLLGHSKITMTARYAHSLADDKIAAVRRLDFAGVRSSPDPNRTPPPNSGEVGEGVKALPVRNVGL